MDLQQEKNSFDNILEKHFPRDIQQKRIRKELQSLNELDQEYYKVSLQNTSLGLKVELSNEFVDIEVERSNKIKLPVAFELMLDPQFPFNLPKLFSKSNVYEPSLADGRDFLEDVIERSWYIFYAGFGTFSRSPTILLKEVITQIPKLLRKLSELKNPEESQAIGRYHPGDLYSLEDLLGMESITVFSGEEMINGNSNQRYNSIKGLTLKSSRYIMIAESFFLRFEPFEKSRTAVKLLSYSSLQSLVNIKKGKDEDKTMILTFLDKEKKSGFSQIKLVLNERNKLLEVLMEKGNKYGAKFSKSGNIDFDIAQYSCKQTPRSRKETIKELLETISALEPQLETNISKELVYALMGLYQKVVEHFATFEDPMYEDFVGRLKNLMEREDIQSALKNIQNNRDNHFAGRPSQLPQGNDEEEEEKKVENKTGSPLREAKYKLEEHQEEPQPIFRLNQENNGQIKEDNDDTHTSEGSENNSEENEDKHENQHEADVNNQNQKETGQNDNNSEGHEVYQGNSFGTKDDEEHRS